MPLIEVVIRREKTLHQPRFVLLQKVEMCIFSSAMRFVLCSSRRIAPPRLLLDVFTSYLGAEFFLPSHIVSGISASHLDHHFWYQTPDVLGAITYAVTCTHQSNFSP